MHRSRLLLSALALTVGVAVGVGASGCSASVSTSADATGPVREAADSTAAPTETSPGPDPADVSSASASVEASNSATASAVSTVTVTSMTATARSRSVDLAWGPVPAGGPDDPPWRIDYHVAGSGHRDVTLYVHGDPSVHVIDLTNGVPYVFTLVAGPGVSLPQRTEATPMGAPEPPVGLIAVTKQPGQITFYWLRPFQGSRPTSFAVTYRVNDGTPVYVETNDDTESYTVKDLRRGDIVTLAAASRNQYGTSDWSTERTATAS